MYMYADWTNSYETPVICIFKKLCKNIHSTNMKNSDNGIYPFPATLCSFLRFDDI